MRHFKPELTLPEIDWHEMLTQQVVFSPDLTRNALILAKHELMSKSGPNLERRKELSPKWFDPWINDIFSKEQTCGSPLVSSAKIMLLDEINDYLRETGKWYNSGILNVAGAEGHPGHRHAASYMIEKGFFPIWVFEQESYLERYKVRGGSYLSLELRLSMWSHYFDNCILTVAPERDPDMSVKDHYQKIFDQAGARYSLAYFSDPYWDEKINRGEFRPDLIIPVLPEVQRTTNRVMRLMPDIRL